MPRVLGEGWIAAYLDYTKHQESTPLYHLWCGLSVLAGALRNNVWLDRVDYSMYPNLYVFLVGASGTGKSTACKAAYRLLIQCPGVKTFHGKMSKEAIFDEMTTFAEVPGMGTQRQSSIYFMADEAKSMLGKTRLAENIFEVMTELYGGEGIPWSIHTKWGGSIEMKDYAINFLGASTAEWLGEVIRPNMFGAGVTARYLWVVNPERTRRISNVDPEQYRADHAAMQGRLVNDLRHIGSLQGPFGVREDALGLWNEWRRASVQPVDPRLESYFERRHDYVLKIAMVLSASASDDLAINLGHIKGAIELLEGLERTMLAGFICIGSPEPVVCARMQEMVGRSSKPVPYGELLAGIAHLVRSHREFDRALRTALAQGLIAVHRGVGDQRKFVVVRRPKSEAPEVKATS